MTMEIRMQPGGSHKPQIQLSLEHAFKGIQDHQPEPANSLDQLEFGDPSSIPANVKQPESLREIIYNLS